MKTLAILSLTGLVSAQAAPYAQCGGSGYSGPTTCGSGWTCQYQNDWFSQCLEPTSGGTTLSTKVLTTTSKTTTTTKATASATGFPTTNGLEFEISGKTNYFAGSNSYWIGFLTNNDDVDLVLGIQRCQHRSIFGTVYYQLLKDGTATINTGADGLQRLDYVVASAEARNVKLIINFVNNWSDYGGMAAYVTAFGGSQTSWYTNIAAQTAYRAYIKAVVSRYIDSPAVFAWELANEPRCKGCDTSVLYNWIKSTSAYIKALDSKHMVAIGDEGFGLDTGSDGSYPYGYGEGLNFTMNLGIDTIDFATFHLYPTSWGTSFDWGNGWVASHGAACAAAGKPCLFEEYGATSDHCSIEAPWQKTALETTGVAGDLYWQYGDTLSSGKSADDGNTIYYGTSEFTCLVTDHVAAIDS
ncbi:unnamed protein product [Penicillium nalgiovense]|nr:unnamed protein product [Penicillium nalgiovense]